MPNTKMVMPMNARMSWGHIDVVEVDPSGLICVKGWSTDDATAQMAPGLKVGRRSVPLHQLYRYPRPDVPLKGQTVPQAGVTYEYLLPVDLYGAEIEAITFAVAGHPDFAFEGIGRFQQPDYFNLFREREVLHRKDIYGYGSPATELSRDVYDLCRGAVGPLLDFGCGSGALVAELRANGQEAYGIEIDREPIRKSIRPGLEPYIVLYDGAMPTKYASGAFGTVICSEVLEHIPDFVSALAEMARLARQRLILTVPDISVIPLGMRHSLVPWHLLEATHFNFFTQPSLDQLLRRFFTKVRFGRLTPRRMNDGEFLLSLVVFADK